MLQPIKCAAPVVVKNNNFLHMFLTFSCWHDLKGFHRLNTFQRREYTKRFPWERYLNEFVDINRIEEYYFINPMTGECYPMYYCVPCGHCKLCKNSKASEWCFRCHCETSTSRTIPLFVTLTYKKSPSKGVCKEDIQLFLKRLRSSLVRSGYDCNLRYFCVSEYGSTTHRPHYHLILWNFPYFDDFSILSDLKIRDFIDSNWVHGYIKTLPLRFGCTSYILKYMVKESIVPEGMNKPFILASRKPGIGAEFCDSVSEFYRTNPDQLDISCFDPYTGTTMTTKLPTYFSTRIFPHLSRMVPRYVRQAFSDLNEIYSYLCSPEFDNLNNRANLAFSLFLDLGDLQSIVNFLRLKYDFLPVWTDFSNKIPLHSNIEIDFTSLVHRVRTAVAILTEYTPDHDFINLILSCISERSVIMADRLPKQWDISSLEKDYDKKLDKLIRKEVL